MASSIAFGNSGIGKEKESFNASFLRGLKKRERGINACVRKKNKEEEKREF